MIGSFRVYSFQLMKLLIDEDLEKDTRKTDVSTMISKGLASQLVPFNSPNT